MNWVGGSRNRLVMKNDAKKQREFFERRKLQQKLKNMNLPTPSTSETGSGSMDLVTLFIVNQIAAKKASKDPPKVAVLGTSKGRSRQKGNKSLVLPMSPCSPSQLSLVEGQPLYSASDVRRRQTMNPQGFKPRQLSPVMESAFSDNSASDYLPPIADPNSPFSTSSASSTQGIFQLQLDLQKHNQSPLLDYSPPPWDNAGVQQTVFQPFTEPRGVIDTITWPHTAFFQLQTPTTTQSLFGNPEPDATKVTESATHVTALFNKESMLDFINQSEAQQEDDIFKGFGREAFKVKDRHFEIAKPKIYLTEETSARTPTAQIVPESQCGGVEIPKCTDGNMSCSRPDTDHTSDCESGHSCEGGYLSSGSTDEEEYCCPHLHYQVANMNCSNSCSPQPSNPGQSHLKSFIPNIRSSDQLGAESTAHPDQKTESSPGQVVSPRRFARPQSSGICKCKRTSTEIQDAETQTEHITAAETRNSSTQWIPPTTGEGESPQPSSSPTCEPNPATGWQSNTTAQAEPHTALLEEEKNENSWKNQSNTASTSSSSISHKCRTLITGKVVSQGLKNPFLQTNGREKSRVEGRDERAQQDGELPDGGMDEVTSASREDSDTIREIADILLLLRQRRKD